MYHMVHNFHGLVFSKFRGNNFHGPRIPLASVRYSKISRSLIFEVRCQSIREKRENYCMRLENLALCSIQSFILCWRDTRVSITVGPV